MMLIASYRWPLRRERGSLVRTEISGSSLVLKKQKCQSPGTKREGKLESLNYSAIRLLYNMQMYDIPVSL